MADRDIMKCVDDCGSRKRNLINGECTEECPIDAKIYLNICASKCPNNYYSDEDVCKLCVSGCKKCIGPGKYDCITC